MLFLRRNEKENNIRSELSLMQDKEYIPTLLEKIEQSSARELLAHELYFYSTQALIYKRVFMLFSLFTVLMPAVVTGLSSFAIINPLYVKILITVFSAISTVSAGILGVFKVRDHWINYRTNCERLKREIILYTEKLAPHKELSAEQSYKLFLERCEEIIGDERNHWRNNNKIGFYT